MYKAAIYWERRSVGPSVRYARTEPKHGLRVRRGLGSVTGIFRYRLRSSHFTRAAHAALILCTKRTATAARRKNVHNTLRQENKRKTSKKTTKPPSLQEVSAPTDLVVLAADVLVKQATELQKTSENGQKITPVKCSECDSLDLFVKAAPILSFD